MNRHRQCAGEFKRGAYGSNSQKAHRQTPRRFRPEDAAGKLKVVAFAMITSGFLGFLVLAIAFASNAVPRQSKHRRARLMTTHGRTIFSYPLEPLPLI
jgi:hypothetical protein